MVCFCALFFACVSSDAADSRLENLSSRSLVGTGSDTLITGFVIGGSAPKEILIRAVGPSLSKLGITNALAHPRMELFNSAGQSVASNDQWGPALSAAFTQVGAWPLPENSLDAALRVTLAPGAYSVQVSGVENGRGMVLVEVYEMDQTSRLLNLSTRTRIETGDGLLISGLVVGGTGTRRVLIRAGGPALSAYGVDGTLRDPLLTVFDRKGTVIARSDNWDEDGQAAEIDSAGEQVGAAPFASGSKDAAAIVELEAGVYSIHVTGVGGTTGVALLEVFDVTDTVLNVRYSDEALNWTGAAVSARLGPRYAELNPGAIDDRPTLFRPESKPADGYYIRINPYELGDVPGSDTDYWSDSGQVGYVPDDPTSDPGLDRIQTFAYYNQVFAISPRLDSASGKPHPDQLTRESNYVSINGAPPMQPVAMVRNYGLQQNEALVVFRDGLFAVAGTQTSRSGSERPYPGFKFPPNKLPRALAVTTSNEFALVAVWDTDRHRGQLAVIALEGRFLPYHTWPYMGLPNQGSFSAVKLLGYIDLPMSSPDGLAAASNGLWTGPSSTDNKVLSQINLADDAMRQLVASGKWQGIVAKGGYAIVSSSTENKVAIVDLTPLFSYMRDSYLASATAFAGTLAARGAGDTDFPQTFAVRPAIVPKVVWRGAFSHPSAVLAGHKVDRWSGDRYKAYVATRDGTLHILDTSSLMARLSTDVRGDLKEIGAMSVGRNPVSLAFMRHAESNLPLLPVDSSGVQRSPDPLNNLLYVACRGDREIDGVVTWQGQGQVIRRIRDSRLDDPVAVSVAVRGNIVSVADFAGRKIVSFRIGTLHDTRNNRVYPPGGDGTYDFEFAGELSLPGSPFLVNSTNVN